jgi:hypothetical protein
MSSLARVALEGFVRRFGQEVDDLARRTGLALPHGSSLSRRDLHKAKDPTAVGYKERAISGWDHLAQAIVQARKALASGDDEQMKEAACYCLMYLSQSREMRAAHQRGAGGNQRGTAQRKDAADRYARYIAEFETRSAGKTADEQLRIRNAIKGMMETAGMKVGPKTMQRRFPIKRTATPA